MSALLKRSLQGQMLPSLTHSSLVSRSYGIPRWASTTSPANPPIAIIGAGPAGLMLARILSLNRIPYTVFERDASPVTRQGSGTLDVHPSSGQLTLKKAGLLDQFNASARHGVNTTIVDDQASVLLRLGGNEDKEERPEIDRKDLQRILQASVPNENIPWGSKIQQVTKSPEGGVSIHLPNENLESGFRLVVGADGARSRVRSLFTDVHPKYTGVTIFTTYIQPSDPIYASAADLAGQGNYLAMSGTQKLFLYYLGDKSYFLSVGTALPEAEAADKSDWSPDLTNLIKHSRGDFRAWPLYNLPLSALSWNHVPGATLLGYAAKLTVPTGDGVNNAIFDGLELAEKIVEHGVDNIEQAVVEYEKAMLPRAKEAIQKGEFMTDVLFGAGAPGSFFKAIGMEVSEKQ